MNATEYLPAFSSFYVPDTTTAQFLPSDASGAVSPRSPRSPSRPSSSGRTAASSASPPTYAASLRFHTVFKTATPSASPAPPAAAAASSSSALPIQSPHNHSHAHHHPIPNSSSFPYSIESLPDQGAAGSMNIHGSSSVTSTSVSEST